VVKAVVLARARAGADGPRGGVAAAVGTEHVLLSELLEVPVSRRSHESRDAEISEPLACSFPFTLSLRLDEGIMFNLNDFG
jgi:hypothetical protein